MKVTRKDNGALVIDLPEAWNVSVSVGRRSRRWSLIFDMNHDDAVKLALQIAVIAPPDDTERLIVVRRDLLERLAGIADKAPGYLEADQTAIEARAVLAL